ncbi:MAG: hypothetical protein KatS3mg062_1273 [Tepidiforma sp.]|nr:MAG: hypothetical protein KatS3mg062_1273 [Tepidiforma sp.]
MGICSHHDEAECTIVKLANGDPIAGVRRRRVRGVRLILRLGFLGVSGWELAAVQGRTPLLERRIGQE